MNKQIQRHHVIILHEFDSPFFTKAIHVPFVPDEMIVKNVTFDMDNPFYGVWAIRSNILPYDLCTISDGSMYSPQTIIQLGKSVNSIWKFEIVDNNGKTAKLIDPSGKEVDFNGCLGITLEFVKYD